MRLIGYIRGLFAEIVVIGIDNMVCLAINGTMVKQQYTKECVDDLKVKNNFNIYLGFSTAASENFYKQSGILIHPRRIYDAILKYFESPGGIVVK